MRWVLVIIMASVVAGCYGVRLAYDDYTRQIWQEKAEAGDPEAEWIMGNSYCCGEEGRFYDAVEAMRWWCSAAKKGYAPAQLALGRIYENAYKITAFPVPKNDVRAYVWYHVAEEGGLAEAGAQRQYLEQYMTEKNLLQAEALLPHWSQMRCVPAREPKGPWNNFGAAE